jgi:hypothetical protein
MMYYIILHITYVSHDLKQEFKCHEPRFCLSSPAPKEKKGKRKDGRKGEGKGEGRNGGGGGGEGK